MAAAKSLVNYFRDVCPHMLPKNTSADLLKWMLPKSYLFTEKEK